MAVNKRSMEEDNDGTKHEIEAQKHLPQSVGLSLKRPKLSPLEEASDISPRPCMNEQRSSIHRLPLEIRSAIFNILVVDYENTILVKPRAEDDHNQVQLPSEKGDSQVLKIFLTYKLFYKEACEIFYQKNLFELVDIRYGIRDWLDRIGTSRRILQQIHISVDASDNKELYEVQEELQYLLSAGKSLPGLQNFGILVLNRHRANCSNNSVFKLLEHNLAVVPRLCPWLHRLVSSGDRDATYIQVVPCDKDIMDVYEINGYLSLVNTSPVMLVDEDEETE